MSSYLSAETPNKLLANAERLGAAGKIIVDSRKLSATPGAITRLVKLLSTAPPSTHRYISCVLLDKETLGQKADEGKLFVHVLKEAGVLVGTQVSMDLVKHPDDLAKCCQELYEAGVRFVKIHTKLEVDPSEQSQLAIDGYANCLARCAAIVQQHGLVPIVAPEIHINGPDNNYIERVLAASYKAFSDYRVLLEGTLLNPNVDFHGFKALKVLSQVIGEDTVRILKRTVPAAVPVIILSHGILGEKEPTFFDAISRDNTRKPWAIVPIIAFNPMDFDVEEGEMEIFQAAFAWLCKAKAMAPVLRSERFGANFGMPGGGGAITGASFDTIEMPGRFDTIETAEWLGPIVISDRFDTVVGRVANFGMPGGGGAVTGTSFVMPETVVDTIEMPEGVDTSEMPGGGANSEMPGGGGGGPAPRGSQNLPPAEYVYEFNIGFNFHFIFSAIAH